MESHARVDALLRKPLPAACRVRISSAVVASEHRHNSECSACSLSACVCIPRSMLTTGFLHIGVRPAHVHSPDVRDVSILCVEMSHSCAATVISQYILEYSQYALWAGMCFIYHLHVLPLCANSLMMPWTTAISCFRVHALRKNKVLALFVLLLALVPVFANAVSSSSFLLCSSALDHSRSTPDIAGSM